MKSSTVFFISLFSCLFMLVVQRAVGIGWDFHPDAVTYTQKYAAFSQNIFDQGVMAVPNNLYFLVAWLFDGSYTILLSLNVLAFSLTNVMLASFFRKYTSHRSLPRETYLILLLVLLLSPYRLHLAVHVLKDTFIIGLLCVIFCRLRFASLAFVGMFFTRIFSVFYLGPMFPRKYVYIGLCLVALIFALKFQMISEFLLGQNQLEMSFREFDRVPNFSEMGALGIVIRALLWPVLVLTGGFIVLSPSVAYFPLAVGAILLQLWSLCLFRRLASTLAVFLVMALLAMLVPGFTSYVRYCFPLMVILPIVMLRNNSPQTYESSLFTSIKKTLAEISRSRIKT